MPKNLFERYQPYRRRAEIAFWVIAMALQAAFNTAVAVVDAGKMQREVPLWQPVTWELSSHLVLLALVPAVFAFERRFPLNLATFGRNWAWHLAGSVVFDRAGKRTGMLASDSGDDADPTFSPDGRSLLFRSSRSGHWDIYRGDADGANPVQLTKDAANDGASRHEYGGEGPAHFSADGKRIAWMRKFPDRGYDVWVMNADGSEAKNLTEAHRGSDAYPSFSPDGRSIAFDSDRDGSNEIYVMAADGSDVRRITISPGGDLAPMWVRVAD